MNSRRMDVADVAAQIAAVLELAKSVGSISKACAAEGVSRKSFYQWKKRLLSKPGRQDGPAYPLPSPEPEWKGRALALCLENPEWGCDRISYYLHLHGVKVSSPTVQKFLIGRGLGRMAQRLFQARSNAHAEDGKVGGYPPLGRGEGRG